MSLIWLRTRFKCWHQRILGGFQLDFLLAVALALLLGVLPMTWGLKFILLVCLTAVVAEIAWRFPVPLRAKIIAAILGAVGTVAMGYRPVVDQYNIDAVLRDYQTTRDLVVKYQAHDDSLKRIVEQYDRLKATQSLFDSITGKRDLTQSAEINARNIEDLKTVLGNFEAIAIPFGNGNALRIKLGLNMYRVIYPVPMRATPNVIFSVDRKDVSANMIESSNIGFTVIFLPLSTPIDHFGISASAEL